MTPLVAAVAALAVYRVTLLVVADKVTEPAREAAIGWLNRRKYGPRPTTNLASANWEISIINDPHRLAYLVDCPWCVSPYVAAGVIALTLWGGGDRWWWLTIGTAAASGVTGLLYRAAHP